MTPRKCPPELLAKARGSSRKGGYIAATVFEAIWDAAERGQRAASYARLALDLDIPESSIGPAILALVRARLVEMRGRSHGRRFLVVASGMETAPGCVCADLHDGKRSSPPPDEVLKGRDARVAAALRQTLTGAMMGDPPPGYSAADARERAP